MTTVEKPHILLVDGMALLFRSFFATSAMGHYFPNEAGVPTNAVQGFARHTMTATFDIQTYTYGGLLGYGARRRFEMIYLKGYKAKRPAPAPELMPQFDMARGI